MLFSTSMLMSEADRLAERAERDLRSCRQHLAQLGCHSREAIALCERAEQAQRELKRLDLYRAVLRSSNAAHALMPEYVVARGLVDPGRVAQ